MENFYTFIMEKKINDFDLIEEFDRDKSEQLLLSDLLNNKEKKILKKYISHTDNNKIKVNYRNNEYGRLTANIKKNGGSSQMNMYNIIKRNILHGIYNDVDISNCHPTIFIQICKNYKLPINNINYIMVDHLIEKLKKDNNINDDDFKILKCKILYGGNVKKYGKQIIEIQNEIINNTDEILKYYPVIIEQAIKKKNDDENKNYNIKGTALSYLIQQIEKQIALTMIEYFKNNNIIVGAYIYDGLHIKNNITNDILLNCEKYIDNNTPFKIKLKIKEFKPDILNKSIIVNNDFEASKEIIKTLPNNYLVYSNERVFYNYDNIYITNEKLIKKFLLKYIMNLNIYKDEGVNKYGEKKFKTLSKDIAPAEKVLKAVLTNINIDETFYEKLWNSNLNKICFKNGYYDLINKSFNNYDNKTFTTIKINRNYEKSNDDDKKLVYDKILNPIFDNNKKLIKYFLNIMSRAIGGNTKDKNWIMCLGFRNCGKGVLVNLFENCFQKYIMTTNSNNFISKSSSGDEAKNLSWSIATEFKRICFTNEIKIDKEGLTKLDGNILKKLSSGGDKIEARLNHSDEVQFRPQSTFVLMANDVPSIEPNDALQTCIELHYPSQFVEDPKENSFIKEYKSDNNIKEFINQPNIINAFIDILFEHFENNKIKMIDEVKKIADSNIEEDDIKLFKNLFKITNNTDDYILINDINNKITNSTITISKKSIKRLLLTLGATSGTKNNKRCYKNIKWVDDDYNENENINMLDD